MYTAKSVRYNDGINYPEVIFIFGTLGFPKIKDYLRKVFSCSEDKFKIKMEDTTISKRPVFFLDMSNFSFIDSKPNKVDELAYNMEMRHASFQSYTLGLNEEVSPKGMFKQNESMLLISEWEGGGKSRWNPEIGRKMDQRKLQCLIVTSYCLEKHLNQYLITAKSFDKEDRYGGELIYCELN